LALRSKAQALSMLFGPYTLMENINFSDLNSPELLALIGKPYTFQIRFRTMLVVTVQVMRCN
jgi:hypothetical protein